MSKAYEDALELVRHAGTGRLLEEKKVANNTKARLVHPDGEVLDAPEVRIRLHETDVVTIRPDGVVRLDSGGWWTVTTKARMNDFAPGVRVYSHRGQGYAATGFQAGSVAVPFYDGLEFDSEAGRFLVDQARVDLEADRLERTRRVKEQVRSFVRLLEEPERARPFVAAIVEGGSWAGDCWYCLMRDEQGVPLGDASGAHDHLEAHLEDEYLVPSLFRNAFRERFGAEQGDQQLGVFAVDVQGGYASTRRRDVGRLMGNYFVKRLVKGGA